MKTSTNESEGLELKPEIFDRIQMRHCTMKMISFLFTYQLSIHHHTYLSLLSGYPVPKHILHQIVHRHRLHLLAVLLQYLGLRHTFPHPGWETNCKEIVALPKGWLHQSLEGT